MIHFCSTNPGWDELTCKEQKEAAAEIESLRNKLNTDSQAFQIECHKAEIEMLRSRLAEAEALLREARGFAAFAGADRFVARIDAYLSREQP